MVIRRVVTPPTRPLLVAPRPTDRAEHVAAHDRRADALVALSHEPVIGAFVTAHLAEHLTGGAGAEHPLVQLGAADTESVVDVLGGSSPVSVERDREVVHAQLLHDPGCTPHNPCSRRPDAPAGRQRPRGARPRRRKSAARAPTPAAASCSSIHAVARSRHGAEDHSSTPVR